MKRLTSLKCSTGIVIWLLGFLLLSCEEEFKMELPDNVVNGIVFKGDLSNTNPPYFFQLTKPASLAAEHLSYEGIEDALVVIEDETVGVKDTLQLLIPRNVQYVGLIYNYYDYHTNKMDEVPLNTVLKNKSRGIYVTTKIYGIEGHTYTLNIYYKGAHHTATETMIPKTPITNLDIRRFDLGEKGESWAPCISFMNPPEIENYYLLYVNWGSIYNYSSPPSWFFLFDMQEKWTYSILNDEHLGDEVKDLLVSEGESVKSSVLGTNYPAVNDSIFVTMQSISKSCYNFLDKAIDQFRTDGGAYSSTPTSVNGNISGGVYGYFRVSAYYEKGKYIGKGH